MKKGNCVIVSGLIRELLEEGSSLSGRSSDISKSGPTIPFLEIAVKNVGIGIILAGWLARLAIQSSS
jgi:hypothetical protein